MALWLVRAGAQGENESLAIDKGVATIGWGKLGDLSKINSREELLELLRKTYPDAKEKAILNWKSQIWKFVKEIKKGDIIALPLKQRPSIFFGQVIGPYKYCEDFPINARHTRPVRWLKEIPRTQIDQDLLYSFGAFLTVCRIQRNNAEERILAILENKPVSSKILIDETENSPRNFEELATDQIRSEIERKFKGHRLAHLVAAILEAKGYKVYTSPEGPDGGIDILASYGELGFSSPRIAVQVKSGNSPIGEKEIREFQGAMENFKAEYGLFVSWAGFKNKIDREIAKNFFKIRLWSSEDLLKEIFNVYNKLPKEIQSDLPLKRIWILVPEAED